MRVGDDELKSPPARQAGERRSALDRLPLWAATILSLGVFVITASLVLYVLGRPSVHGWTHLGTGDLPWKDRLLYAGAVVTLSGAVVALVVNYRKQKDAETSRFSVSFAEACQQLGDASPAVRIAGVYALAALADRYHDRCQQCIDVLCGYIRLPYDPEASAAHITEKSVETKPGTVVKHAYRADDREVRLTIIRVIRDHLRTGAPAEWQGYDFDFTGAKFDGGNFSGAVFSGGTVSFTSAVFSGDIDFDQVKFTGGTTYFLQAKFSGGSASFINSEFAGGAVYLADADFSGSVVSFIDAKFSGGSVRFSLSRFSGGAVVFLNPKFSGGTVHFDGATVSGGVVNVGAKLEVPLKGELSLPPEGAIEFTGAKFPGTESGRAKVLVYEQSVKTAKEAERALHPRCADTGSH